MRLGAHINTTVKLNILKFGEIADGLKILLVYTELAAPLDNIFECFLGDFQAVSMNQ